MRIIFIALLLSASARADERILFVGNSLTYWNNLPATVCELGRLGGRKVTCEVVAYPNFSLEDHWNSGAALKRIGEERWTWVVLQQGTSASPAGRQSLIEYVSRFATAARAAGARPALYAVWPAAARREDFDAAIESHRFAAESSQTMLLPVSTAWKRGRHLSLYSPDGLHPSATGSYLSALVIYRGIFGELPRKACRTKEQKELCALAGSWDGGKRAATLRE